MSLLSTLSVLKIVAERLVLGRADEPDRAELVELHTDDAIRAYRPAMTDR